MALHPLQRPVHLPAGLKATLSGNSSAGWTLTEYQTSTVVTFDTNGNPTQVADRNNNVTSIGFPYGNLGTVTSDAGPTAARNANFSYSSSTGTLTVTQTNGSSTRNAQFTKNTSSQLVSIEDPNSKTTNFTYTSGLLTKIVNAAGEETDITYNSGGQVTEVDQHNTTSGSPGTSTTRFQYTSATETRVAGPDTPAGSFPTSGYADFTINANDMVTATVDAAGRARSSSYSTQGLDLTSSSSGSGSTASGSTYGYSPSVNGGQSMTSSTEGLSSSNPTSTFAYGNTSASTQYLPASGTNDAGNQLTLGYNGPGNPTTSNATSSTTTVATLNYPSSGNVGLPTSAAAPGNGSDVTGYSYTNNQLTGITPVTYTPTTGSHALGSQTLTYDAFGRLHTESDGRGITTTYTYDNDDRLLTTAFSDGTPTVTNTYDAVGDRLTQASGSGTITNTYDQLGHLLTTVNTAGGGTETYAYDYAGNQVSVTDGRGTTTNTFDPSGVLEYTTYNHGSGTQLLTFATDANGRRTGEWLQSNHIVAPATAPTVWAADVLYTYDTSNRITSVVANLGPASSPTVEMNVTYSYDPSTTGTTCQANAPAAGDRSQLQSTVNHVTGQTTIYCYDTSNRLIKVAQSGGNSGNNTYTYTYDVRGNRLTNVVTGTNPSSQTLTYNAANQITTAGYTYDADGNLTASPAGTYTYNGAEQMTTSVEGGVTYNYTYAGASQNEVLAEQWGGGSNSVQITYGRSSIEGYNVNGTNAYLENDPVTGQANMLRTSSGENSLYVYDGTGNPVALLTDFSTSAYQYTYDPYGAPTLSQTSGGSGTGQNPYLFKGGIQDRATGFVKFGGRWYDPTIGSWTQQDTLDAPLDPANANRYEYAGDDPINDSDPSGNASAFATIIKIIALTIDYGSLQAAIDHTSPAEVIGALTGIGFDVACTAATAEAAAVAGPGALIVPGICAAISFYASQLAQNAAEQDGA